MSLFLRHGAELVEGAECTLRRGMLERLRPEIEFALLKGHEAGRGKVSGGGATDVLGLLLEELLGGLQGLAVQREDDLLLVEVNEGADHVAGLPELRDLVLDVETIGGVPQKSPATVEGYGKVIVSDSVPVLEINVQNKTHYS